MAIKHAQFKTAYLQRGVTLDAQVATFVDLNVTALVKYVAGTHAAIVPASSLAEATHIIAQSDMTLIPADHPKMELRDYRYSDKVAAGFVKSGTTADTAFLGCFATAPTDTTASDKWYFNTTDGKMYKSTYSSSTLSWAEDTSVTLGGAHKLNLYPIFDKADVVEID